VAGKHLVFGSKHALVQLLGHLFYPLLRNLFTQEEVEEELIHLNVVFISHLHGLSLFVLDVLLLPSNWLHECPEQSLLNGVFVIRVMVVQSPDRSPTHVPGLGIFNGLLVDL